MELNREQIIKDWEDEVEVGKSVGLQRDFINYVSIKLVNDTLSLIKELTEENERLRAAVRTDTVICRARGYGKQQHMQKLITIRHSNIGVDTMQRIQTKFAVHFGTYTDKDEVKVADVFRLLKQFTEEMLEEVTTNGD